MSAAFYSSLSASALPIARLIREVRFSDLPEDWYIIIGDIRNSTDAVHKGARNDVNMVAAGCLIAGLNIARAHGLEVPFFFGGDGGTLLIPGELQEEVLAALRTHSHNTERAFGMTMHLGAVPVTRVYEAGHIIKLSKTRLSNGFNKAVVIGDGLLWAERFVKSGQPKEEADMSADIAPDMEGLECRWDKVPPPKEEQAVVCYLIEALDPSRQQSIYADVLDQADAVFGNPALRNPLSTERLKLLLSAHKMRGEMMARFGRWKWRYFLAEMLRTAVGRLALSTGSRFGNFSGADYLKEVISNADTLTLDGRINTIITGTDDQSRKFLAYLDTQEAAGLLRYGHHFNRASIMTCYIRSRNSNHIHFVDGSDGGYTAAAQELKRKAARGSAA